MPTHFLPLQTGAVDQPDSVAAESNSAGDGRWKTCSPSRGSSRHPSSCEGEERDCMSPPCASRSRDSRAENSTDVQTGCLCRPIGRRPWMRRQQMPVCHTLTLTHTPSAASLMPEMSASCC
ncbi:unnamed protein product [Vitrella brassicaformis CCMP3155]|uniref:Uncharacterized protein n=1 Tax=Vitrella brassicaformis (strain CCMP3155) TaxID=1169540 RepID=A0A0G4EY68_VITBC|nr:unnamed protein product [Vitrella brassicaformis CCMP3155]|eukprot:CEM03574.1 unnamed protein product [Vitrella brassicaformis CCMP3155]